MPEPRTWSGEFYEGSNFLLLALAVGLDQAALVQADLSASSDVHVDLFDRTTGSSTPVFSVDDTSTDTDVNPDSVPFMSNTLQTGYGWPDTTGFNFMYNVVNSTWTTPSVGGHLYACEVSLDPAGASKNGVVYIKWELRCLPVKT